MRTYKMANFWYTSIRLFHYYLTFVIRAPMGILLMVGFVAACASPVDEKASSVPVYDQHSWKTMIAPECKTFFDGCNTCRRAPGGIEAACTRKACMEYLKPKCLDDSSKVEQPNIKQQTFASDGSLRFRVYFGSFASCQQSLRLQQDQVMFVNGRSHTAPLLTHISEVSVSRYCDRLTTFWAKGSNALVTSSETPLYRNCITLI